MKALYFLLPALFFLLLPGCQLHSDNRSGNISLTDSVSVSGVSGDSVKLVKTADINLKVKDVEKGTKEVSELTRKFGGMVFHQSFKLEENERKELKVSTDSLMVISTYSPGADVKVRIPSEHLEDFLYGVAALGYLTQNSTLNIEDKSLTYLENRLKQKNRIAIATAKQRGKLKGYGNYETVQLKDEMVDQQIDNMGIDGDVKYSSVSLSLFQNPELRKEIMVNNNLSDYQLPFGQRLADALKEGWQFFLSILLLLAQIWVFIILCLVCFLFYKQRQQKKLLV